MAAVIKLRGLPFSCKEAEIANFLTDYGVDASHVLVTFNNQGRVSGEAFVTLADEALADRCVTEMQKAELGSRYIEFFNSSLADRDAYVGSSGAGATLRLRGLPFSSKKTEVAEFLGAYGVRANNVLMGIGADGRPSGEAFVTFSAPEAAERAEAEMQGQQMGSRYVEIFKSSHREYKAQEARAGGGGGKGGGGKGGGGGADSWGGGGGGWDMWSNSEAMKGMMKGMMKGLMKGDWGSSWSSPYATDPWASGGWGESSGGGGYGKASGKGKGKITAPSGKGPVSSFSYAGGGEDDGTVIRMRGLPFSASALEVAQFFDGYGIDESQVAVNYGMDGRPSGEAFVAMPTAELATQALTDLQRQQMGTRYIELFNATSAEWEKAQGGYSAGAKRPRGPDVSSGDPWLDDLVSQIKAIQRSGEDAKMKWWAFCDNAGVTNYDPKRHDGEFLSSFIEQFNSGML